MMPTRRQRWQMPWRFNGSTGLIFNHSSEFFRLNEIVRTALIDDIDHFIGISDWTLYVQVGSLLIN
jgi:hypothetical protein